MENKGTGNSVAGLQTINLLRFVSFLIISIAFTKIGISKEQIGLFEVSTFIASASSFFWTSGLIQAFLPLYRNSKTFGIQEGRENEKSAEIFNIYILLLVFSIVVSGLGKLIQQDFSVFGNKGNVPLLNVTLLYLFLSSPANLVEYIYMLRNRPGNIISYGYIVNTVQLFIVLVPLVLGYDIIVSLWGLVVIAIIRNLWLFFLLYSYAEFTISKPFMKEVLQLGAPLIVSALISGAAQYVDGVVITSSYEAESFAIFRYGSKELPFITGMAAALTAVMLTQFSNKRELISVLPVLKKKSLKLMHILFPVTIGLLLVAKPLYIFVFSADFTRSADIFVVYLLVVTSRLLFPHTILIGLKKTKVIFVVSIVEIITNIILSYWLLQFYGTVGVALATVFVYLFTQAILIGYNYFVLGVNPLKYIPFAWYLFYCSLLSGVFVVLDRGIVKINF